MFVVIAVSVALQAEQVAPSSPPDPKPPAPITLGADAFIRPNQQRLNDILSSNVTPGLPGGAATVECTVGSAGKLIDCKVVSETPNGAGVGRAVLAMVRLFKLPPVLPDGQKVEGGTVRIPIKFGR